MQNKRIQRVIIWIMVLLIVVSGLLFGLSMLTTM